jgi:hypothetical protein
MRLPFSKSEDDQPFWSWFAAHAQELAAAQTERDAIVGEMYRRFLKEAPGLAFEVGRGDGDEREFVISADGIHEKIPMVQRLVASSPKIPGWRIVAFRPRHGSDSVVMNGLTLRRDMVRFVVADATPGYPLHLVILIEGMKPADPDPYINAAFLILDGVLGEYDVMTQLGDLDFRPLDSSYRNARPIVELAEVVDARR